MSEPFTALPDVGHPVGVHRVGKDVRGKGNTMLAHWATSGLALNTGAVTAGTIDVDALFVIKFSIVNAVAAAARRRGAGVRRLRHSTAIHQVSCAYFSVLRRNLN